MNLVGNNIPLIPPHLSSSTLLWSRLDSAPASYIPNASEPQPSPHIASPSLDAPQYYSIPPTYRLTHLLFGPPPVLSHLGPAVWESGEGDTYLRPPGRAKKHGELQTESVRTVDGTGRDRTERRRSAQCTGCWDMPVGSADKGR